MEEELTVGGFYDDIADRLALARTRALMGEFEAAQQIFQPAAQDFDRYREVLQTMPGFYALEYALQHTHATLCTPLPLEEPATSVPAVARQRARRRVRKAA
jgi:hypothetical protein